MGMDAAKLDYKRILWSTCQYRVLLRLRIQVRGGPFQKSWGVGLHHQTGSTDAEPPEAEYDPGSVGRKSFTIQEPRRVDVKLGESNKWARVMSAVVGKFRDIAGSI